MRFIVNTPHKHTTQRQNKRQLLNGHVKRHAFSSSPEFYCAYVFIDQQKLSNGNGLFSTDCHALKSLLPNCPLFLNKEQVFEYSRFMGDNAFIVKLYTPGSTIMCHDQKLTLRAQGLKKSKIQGIYLVQRSKAIYQENPYFDENWYDRNEPIICFEPSIT